MKLFTARLASCFMSLTFAQDISIESFAPGLSNPVNFKHAGDDRLFVTERRGTITVINADGSVNAFSFLNIDDRVTNSGSEQGLLAMAFHPNYTSNGFFYINYIDHNEDTVISRFTRSSINVADPNSGVILLNIVQPFVKHNGGNMHFRPDGYMYITLGDGGAVGDPENRAQSLNTLLVKIFRIDVDATEMGSYDIPLDNPFFGDTAALGEMWAYKLRNTGNFYFDRTTGDLWSADVGDSQIEEINKVDAPSTDGENYGWKCFEGNSTFVSQTSCSTITHKAPVTQYTHSSTGECSITRDYVYRIPIQTTLQGLYFFVDSCNDSIGFAEGATPRNYDISFIENYSEFSISAFGEDINGELYRPSLFQGSLFKLKDVDLRVQDQSVTKRNMFPNPVKDVLTFDAVSTSNQIESITIHDTQGELIATHSNFEEQLITIPTTSLTTRFHIVEISNSKGDRSIRKLIVK
ncbi:PQQ-dependent sugar dehydrogenase [Psychroserpens sp.]|jgi:hypothetical protein|uniref:PQQ-dependent sugar dehydrogenase n=1 Tax=Psychroserpens sp. TaxID=2020870 RepID=UPI0039E28C30